MAYESFASVYDVFMDNVEYDAWAAYLTDVLREQDIADGLVCELGCGTGAMTERLSAAGYDMIGIDSSEEMLEAALEKKDISGADILYLQQDMRSFELYGTVRAVVSVCDCMNYLTEEADLLQVFRLVNNYLDPGGLFLFDMHTAACYEAIGDSVIAENREDGSFIWENSYDPESGVNEYLLTLFLPEKKPSAAANRNAADEDFSAADSDAPDEDSSTADSAAADEGLSSATVLYRKEEELHVQRAYPPETIWRLLEEAGLTFVSMTDAYTGRPVSSGTERILFIARECTKNPDDLRLI